uniref:Uncharacterized protein n=1 Tax=Ananas comosus var. bracteatus TaxID=296719 RepID=A0A6V7NP55_ANACO|nr:unnamed protein product [Ananas comosus var. bracteatus]
MPESEFAKMAFNGMHFKIKDHFEDKFFPNLFDLGVRVAQYEQFRKGNNEDRPRWSRNKDWNKGKEKNISFFEESSTHEEPNSSEEAEDSADEVEICAAEMVRNSQPYKCALLKPAKSREAKAQISAFSYSFDIAKTDLIFDRLLKDGRIKLQEGQTIPPVEELKRRRYCKWHHSWSHKTSECTAFKRQIQKEINEGRLIFADQENKDMEFDKNPFPSQINAVNMKGKGKATAKRQIQEEIEEGRLILADQENENQIINKSLFLFQVNMVNIKGKEVLDKETADNVVHAKKHLRLCIKCKAEMTKKDWEAIVNAKKRGNEWNELMAFPEDWDDIPDGEDQEEEGSDAASNDTEPEVDSVQCKKDMLMQKILHDYYNNRRGERHGRWTTRIDHSAPSKGSLDIGHTGNNKPGRDQNRNLKE